MGCLYTRASGAAGVEGSSRGAPRGSSCLPAESPGVPLNGAAPAKRRKPPLGPPRCRRPVATEHRGRLLDSSARPALSTTLPGPRAGEGRARYARACRPGPGRPVTGSYEHGEGVGASLSPGCSWSGGLGALGAPDNDHSRYRCCYHRPLLSTHRSRHCAIT